MTGREPSKASSESIYNLKERINSLESKVDYNDKIIRIELNSNKEAVFNKFDFQKRELEIYINDKILELARALQPTKVNSDNRNLWGMIAFFGLVVAILFIAITSWLTVTQGFK